MVTRPYLTLLFLLCCFVFGDAQFLEMLDDEDVHQEFFDLINRDLDAAAFSRGTVKFDQFMLTRIHPAAVCRADDDQISDSCMVPPHAPTWSIHGLWPTRNDGSYPQFCDGIPKDFDIDLLKDIEKDLRRVWINVDPKSDVATFWSHEYQKHGKCAQREEAFRHEVDYFNQTMMLHKSLDIEYALARGRVVPRREPYDAAYIHEVLSKYLGNGHNVQIHCVTDRKTGDTMLADIRVCLDLNLKLVDCLTKKVDQPVTEEVGRKLPLPTFHPCSGKIVVIDSSLDEASEDYDEYMLTRIYPAAVCRADDDAVPDSCEIPEGAPNWTLHGLWPERSDGTYPQFCPGRPRRFDPNLIKPIKDRLNIVWPNLYPKKAEDDFWRHEYEKHGTCAQIDSRFGSELKYFNTSMYLNTLFDVESALTKGGIVPRGESYAVEDVQAALNEHLGKGHFVQMNCLSDKKTGKTLLADTRLCMSIDWNLVDCPKGRKFQKTRAYPLPTFKPCRGRITFLPADGSEVNYQDAPINDDLLFFVHPYIGFTTHYWSKETSVLLMLFSATGVVYVCYKIRKEITAHKYHHPC